MQFCVKILVIFVSSKSVRVAKGLVKYTRSGDKTAWDFTEVKYVNSQGIRISVVDFIVFFLALLTWIAPTLPHFCSHFGCNFLFLLIMKRHLLFVLNKLLLHQEPICAQWQVTAWEFENSWRNESSERCRFLSLLYCFPNTRPWIYRNLDCMYCFPYSSAFFCSCFGGNLFFLLDNTKLHLHLI